MKLSFVYAYYNNADDLKQQLAIWTGYPESIRRQLDIILVDDGSPTPLRIDVTDGLNLSVYRVTQDIGFNLGGARNVGAYVAPDGWLFLSDIDQFVSAAACRQMLNLPDDPRMFYTVRRQVNGQPFRDPPNAFIVHRASFWQVGGYDEDLAGEYGGEDFLLWTLMSRKLQAYDSEIVVEQTGNTRYSFPAKEPNRSNLERNDQKVRAKLTDASYRPTNPFRVPWVPVSVCRFAKTEEVVTPGGDSADSEAIQYREACQLAVAGDHASAQRRFSELDRESVPAATRALAVSNLGTLAAVSGAHEDALQTFHRALELDDRCESARVNLIRLDACRADTMIARMPTSVRRNPHTVPSKRPIKVAILSFLFNWPSTGGGIVHTVELAKFLSRAGYEVRHFFPRNEDWGVGRVQAPLSHEQVPLEFDAASWEPDTIRRRFREAVDQFDPDCAIITDSWNTKPLLAEAVRDYPFFLRLQAQELLCPLNNLRLLRNGQQCPRHQLATPDVCYTCVEQNRRMSGSLHEAERQIAGVGQPEYYNRLRWAVGEAEAVLVVNRLTEALIEPYARTVHVVPSGFDPQRFPWPWPDETSAALPGLTRILFASLTGDAIKGFHVMREACRLLWAKRRDFELVVTSEPSDMPEPFERYVGWTSQEELPRLLRSCDFLVFPTIAQEALGRTAVEAMAVGRPVIASRIGGLQFTVTDGATGLLVEPGDPVDLAAKLEILADAPELRAQMGLAGRQRFETEFTWDVILERHYRPLLRRRTREPIPSEPSVVKNIQRPIFAAGRA